MFIKKDRILCNLMFWSDKQTVHIPVDFSSEIVYWQNAGVNRLLIFLQLFWMPYVSWVLLPVFYRTHHACPNMQQRQFWKQTNQLVPDYVQRQFLWLNSAVCPRPLQKVSVKCWRQTIARSSNGNNSDGHFNKA